MDGLEWLVSKRTPTVTNDSPTAAVQTCQGRMLIEDADITLSRVKSTLQAIFGLLGRPFTPYFYFYGPVLFQPFRTKQTAPISPRPKPPWPCSDILFGTSHPRYTFFYMPFDKRRNVHCGFAFINFRPERGVGWGMAGVLKGAQKREATRNPGIARGSGS